MMGSSFKGAWVAGAMPHVLPKAKKGGGIDARERIQY